MFGGTGGGLRRPSGRCLVAGAPEDIVAEDVRATVVCLGQVTGEDLVEDLLDEVFSRFCIGK